MACGVCEHCQSPINRYESTVREGFSYHKACHKCYVCSETNLQNAEVFKGVIFCSSCCQRIFDGCATARKSKNPEVPDWVRFKKQRKRKRSRTKDKSRAKPGVLELTTLAVSTDSDSNNSDSKIPSLSKTLALSTELSLHVGKLCPDDVHSIKRDSVEMGTTTDVTQELLKQLHCPVVKYHSRDTVASPAKPLPKYKKETKNSKIYSDLRIAELGASTEIANMALRNKSELPIIIKSETCLKNDSVSLSVFNPESDISGDNDEWLESYTTIKEETRWMDRKIGSILKLPYKCFKRKILERSSLISVLMSSKSEKSALLKRIKRLFYEEITEHQCRGIKRLYSTINRRKVPHKLGWLNLVAKVSGAIRCQHFRRSHSYRCMRAQVMRIAGPTKSELAAFRNKVKNTVVPTFLKNLLNYNGEYAAITMNQACGSDPHSQKSK